MRKGGTLPAAAAVLLPAVLLVSAAAAPAPPAPGDVLVAVRATTVRTRGAGNMRVDLPRGRAVRVVGIRPDGVLLEPAPADAVLLRSFGVRRMPRYTAGRAQIEADFLSRAAWTERRAAEIAGIRARWPDLDARGAEAVFAAEPFVGMTLEQAEAAVGDLLLERAPAGPEGAEIWRIGARGRSAELRLFTEGRDPSLKPGTFDDYLKNRTRAVLTFRDGRLAAIEAP